MKKSIYAAVFAVLAMCAVSMPADAYACGKEGHCGCPKEHACGSEQRCGSSSCKKGHVDEHKVNKNYTCEGDVACCCNGKECLGDKECCTHASCSKRATKKGRK